MPCCFTINPDPLAPQPTHAVIDCCTLKIHLTDNSVAQSFNLNTLVYEISGTSIFIKDGVNLRSVPLDTAYVIFGTPADPLALTTYIDSLVTVCRCDKPIVIPEQLFPFTMDITDGQTLTLADVMAAAAASSGLAPLGVAGFDFDLKQLNGEAVTGLLATASDATSSGPHGLRNLDGGGSFQVGVVETNKDIPTYRRLSLAQTFTAAPNSVAVILIEMIYL